MIASLDLTLALIEEDNGAELARRVSMLMVTYLQRSANQDQLSMFTTSPRPAHAALRDVVDYALERPADDLSTSALAERVNISPRQLSRLFREHLNETPAAAVRRIRLELRGQAARRHRATRQRCRATLRLCDRGDVSPGVHCKVRSQPSCLPRRGPRRTVRLRRRRAAVSWGSAQPGSPQTHEWP